MTLRVAKPILDFLKKFNCDTKEYLEDTIEIAFEGDFEHFLGDPLIFVDVNELKKIPAIAERLSQAI